MFLNRHVGNLAEPLSGRKWDCDHIHLDLCSRLAYFQDNGLAPGDVVFVHHGNTLEFFVDLLAIWYLGAYAVPLGPQLNGFQIEVLARAAAPRFSLRQGEPDSEISEILSATGLKVMQTAPPAGGRPARQLLPFPSPPALPLLRTPHSFCSLPVPQVDPRVWSTHTNR